jgi:uracil-DNA glycosylase
MRRNIFADILKCGSCELCKTRSTVVIGRGRLPCDVLYIGEAPGIVEDYYGESFVGDSGQLLDSIIKIADTKGTTRNYFTNTVLCRPTTEKNGDNREPTKAEIQSCRTNVNKIISRAKPKIVVLTGGVAKQAFRKKDSFDCPVFTIVHPSNLLRRGGKASPNYLHTLRTLQKVYELCQVSV